MTDEKKDTSKVIKELSDVVIIDAILFRNLPLDELMEVGIQISKFKSENKEVKLISNLSSYKSLKAIKDNIANDICLKEHLEYFLDRKITDDEFNIVTTYSNALKSLNSLLTKVSLGNDTDYKLQELPDLYETGLENVVFCIKVIKRYTHMMGYKTFAMLWTKCLLLWGYNEPIKSFFIKASGRDSLVIIGQNNVKIGCQTIPRFEIERVALKLGLSFKI